jgi:hypothetical protein
MAKTKNGNPIAGISLVASTLPWVGQLEVWVWISAAMDFSFDGRRSWMGVDRENGCRSWTSVDRENG